MTQSNLAFIVGGALILSTIVAHAIENEIRVSQATPTEVVFETVNTTEDAIVVVHSIKPDGDGRTPDTEVALGWVAVKSGQNANVKLQLNQPAAKGRLLAVLYVDAGAVGQFEPEKDKPVTKADGKIVSDRFKVQ